MSLEIIQTLSARLLTVPTRKQKAKNKDQKKRKKMETRKKSEGKHIKYIEDNIAPVRGP